MPRISPRRLVAALLAAALVIPALPAGAAAAPAGPTLTWTVQPADAKGPDGRRWVEHTLDPGQVVTEHLAVRNLSAAAAVFALKAADGYLTDKGRFNMLPSDKASVDGGTWIDVAAKVTVPANGTRVVPFTITVPGDAAPGDHPAGIAATVTSSGGQVNVESRVGFRVMLRAGGTINPALRVDDLAAGYQPSWNPFAAGRLTVGYAVANNGNVWVTGRGRVEVSGFFGLAGRGTRAEVADLLPGANRTAGARVAGVWPWGPVRTTVVLTPVVLGGDPGGAAARPVSATVTTWALPWPQLILVTVLVALLLMLRAVARRRRRRLARLLADARRQGRESALAEENGTAPA